MVDAKCFLVAIGSSVCCSPAASAAAAIAPALCASSSTSAAATPAHEATAWASAAEARALLADFESLPPPKMAKRMGLALSPTLPWLGEYRLQRVRDAGHRLELLNAPPAGVVQAVLCNYDSAYPWCSR